MSRNVPVPVRALILAMLLAPPAALACGEGMFIAGNGLQFQSYLAPRPATVLIYAPAEDQQDERLHAGLAQAGHSLTVVVDQATLDQALSTGRFDVLIADLDRVEGVVGARAGGAQVLPLVPRALRGSRELRERFELFLVDGAGLGQHLRAIDRLVAGS